LRKSITRTAQHLHLIIHESVDREEPKTGLIDQTTGDFAVKELSVVAVMIIYFNRKDYFKILYRVLYRKNL
jgi:hypothetical protein